MEKVPDGISRLNKKITSCRRCPRLASYIREVAQRKVRRFAGEKYWGRPLTGFGDIYGRLLIVGLAPAAHGGNRTGRMFTGDSSGDWLARALYENGFYSKPTSQSANDGLRLVDTYVTASVRCAPPQNKPTRDEFDNCFPYLEQEFALLNDVRVIVCLGRIAFDTCRRLLGLKGAEFGHGNLVAHDNLTIICSYHPSRQNTQTGRLGWKEWSAIFARAKSILESRS